MDREKFAASAPTIKLVVNGKTFDMPPKEVKDGKSLGWFLSGKVPVTIDGEEVKCQLGVNLTVVGSKPDTV